MFRHNLFSFLELVGQEIKKDKSGSRGEVMHDGWTDSGIHFLGVYCVFIRIVPFLNNGERQ